MKKLLISLFVVGSAYLLLSIFFPAVFGYHMVAFNHNVPYIYLGLGLVWFGTYRSVK